MRKFGYFLFVLIMMGTAVVMLQKRYSIFSVFEPSTIANKGKEEEYLGFLREGMMNRERDIQISFTGKADEVKKYSVDAIDRIFEMDDPNTSCDYDYLKFHYAGTSVSMTGLGRNFQVRYQVDYLETRNEMEQVDEKVKQYIADANLLKKSAYKRVKKIHDFIIKNAQYDVSTKNNSAYACLFKGSSACQGYAALTYKMMTEAEIPCRIIAGKSSGESHAWNIVKVDGKWYNLDCTWDDPVGEPDFSTVHYEFFLKSDGEFKDHIRDAEYDSQAFRRTYPIAHKSYGS